ncbi:hypothetical protein GE21DRAFT_1082545 [Neurospora crassa]|nr:hypothetical protein GE21DRAFT_1082545 [Neurospora crassa]
MGDSGLGRVTSHLVSVKVTRAGIGGARGWRAGATAVELPGPRTRTNQGRLSWRGVVHDPEEQQVCPVMVFCSGKEPKCVTEVRSRTRGDRLKARSWPLRAHGGLVVLGQEVFLAETSWSEAQDIMTGRYGFGSEVGGGRQRVRRHQTGQAAPH